MIIPCKGHAPELRACLNGLHQQEGTTVSEIIVIDSNADDAVKAVSQEFPGITLIRSHANLRAAAARNLGVANARGSRIAFIDADCIPSPQWIGAAETALADGAQMVGGPVVDAVPDNPVAVTDNLLQFAELSIHRPRSPVDVLPGCNLAVNKSVLHRIPGFPDVPYIEDSLFTHSVSRYYPDDCWFVPGMVVAHRGRSHIAGFYYHQRRFGYTRGRQGFKITRRQQRLGRHAAALPLIIFKRLIFIYRQTLAWKRARFFNTLALLPLILLGLTGWSIGFRNGCRDAVHAGHDQKER